MSKLATTAIGGLAALTALLVLRARRPVHVVGPDLMVIHAEPRYDTPSLQRAPRGPGLLVVPLN